MLEARRERGGRARRLPPPGRRRPGRPPCARSWSRWWRSTAKPNARPYGSTSSTCCSIAATPCATGPKCAPVAPAAASAISSSTRPRTPIRCRWRSCCCWASGRSSPRSTGGRCARRLAGSSWWATLRSRSTAPAAPTCCSTWRCCEQLEKGPGSAWPSPLAQLPRHREPPVGDQLPPSPLASASTARPASRATCRSRAAVEEAAGSALAGGIAGSAPLRRRSPPADHLQGDRGLVS